MNGGLLLVLRRVAKPCLLGFFLCVGGLQSACAGGGRDSVPPIPSHRPAAQGVYHEVKPGQTLWSIAQAYKVDVQMLIRANQMALEVSTGQKLYIPGATQQREVVSRCPCEPAPLPPVLSSSGPNQRWRSTPPITHTAFAPNPSPPLPRATPPHELATLIWPTDGEVSRGFGRHGTHRHDGLDIAAPRGTPIYAAADGEVIFSDWGPGGYGRMVILQHQADTVTVYAHNQTNLVQVGQRVRQGERIATVGQSGRATGNHLHFEVRRNATPISPTDLLPRRSNRLAALDRD